MNKFRTIEEARQLAEQCLWPYNNERSNMATGDITLAMKFKETMSKENFRSDPSQK